MARSTDRPPRGPARPPQSPFLPPAARPPLPPAEPKLQQRGVAGLALAIASANVVFRDIEHIVSAALLPWFFLTPVLYTFSQFDQHPTLKQLLRWGNPITPPIEALRDAQLTLLGRPELIGKLRRAPDTPDFDEVVSRPAAGPDRAASGRVLVRQWAAFVLSGWGE